MGSLDLRLFSTSSHPCPTHLSKGSGAYNNTALFEESGLIRITLGASTVSSVSSARSGRAQDQDSQRGRSYLR